LEFRRSRELSQKSGLPALSWYGSSLKQTAAQLGLASWGQILTNHKSMSIRRAYDKLPHPMRFVDRGLKYDGPSPDELLV